jgi:hypothetical protein
MADRHVASVEVDLTQAEADRLLKVGKHYRGKKSYIFPSGGKKLQIPLVSSDKREKFFLDVNSMRLDITKVTFQTRVRIVIPLARVDIIKGGFHRNPDGTIITGSHIHRYREGYGDKWAEPLPSEFGNTDDVFQVFHHFLEYCNVIEKPIFDKPLFTNP